MMMRYINRLFTYLLAYLLAYLIQRVSCAHRTVRSPLSLWHRFSVCDKSDKVQVLLGNVALSLSAACVL